MMVKQRLSLNELSEKVVLTLAGTFSVIVLTAQKMVVSWPTLTLGMPLFPTRMNPVNHLLNEYERRIDTWAKLRHQCDGSSTELSNPGRVL